MSDNNFDSILRLEMIFRQRFWWVVGGLMMGSVSSK